ncbi:MAG: SDR family NAD(P)-dependent oxidoreductase [Alkalispirochaeta sp.]
MNRKYAIVTGASRGLGAALVRSLLDDDTRVIAVSRTRNERLVKLAADRGQHLTWIPADLADIPTIGRVWDRIRSSIDSAAATEILLVGNAATPAPVGLTGATAPDDQSTAVLESAIDLNVTAPIALTQQFVAHFGPRAALPACTRRTIIHISSGASGRVMPGLATYSASKAGVNMFVRAAAEECEILHRRGAIEPVRILAISPGLVDTEMQETLRSTDAALLPGQEDYIQWRTEGRLKPPEEVVPRILALVHEDLPESGAYRHYDEL